MDVTQLSETIHENNSTILEYLTCLNNDGIFSLLDLTSLYSAGLDYQSSYRAFETIFMH